jgi:hypothetical protein
VRSLSLAFAFVLLASTSLSACGSGGGTSGAVPSNSVSWVAALRANPTVVQLSLANAQAQYMYVDSGPTNGVYPSAGTFAAEIQAANPGLLGGSCSKLAHMTAATMQFTDASGTEAPSYVVFFTPQSTGSCTQSIDLGADGTQSFSVIVGP